MRILTLSQFYAPEPGFKVLELGRELLQRGHSVSALTGFPNFPQGKIYPGYRQRLWMREEMDGVNIVRFPLYPDHSASTLKRSLNYLSFAASATALGPMFSGSADVMWVYQPPLTVGIPAWWTGKLRNIPFVHEIQDMWPETVATSGMMNEGRVTRLLGKMAHFVYRRATAITVISPGFKRNLIAKGVPEEKIHIIPNWADEDTFRPVPKEPELGAKYGLSGKINIMFAGNMGPAQGLETVIEAAALLRDRNDIQFVLVGDGIDLPKLQSETERQRLGNVRFIERQPAKEIPRFYAWADALLVQLRDDPLFHMTIPSKTLAYLACGRPILCAVPGDGSDVVRQANAGLICAPGSPQALADCVAQFQALPIEQREAMGAAGREAFLTQYTRKTLVDRYETLFEAIRRRRSGEYVSA